MLTRLIGDMLLTADDPRAACVEFFESMIAATLANVPNPSADERHILRLVEEQLRDTERLVETRLDRARRELRNRRPDR